MLKSDGMPSKMTTISNFEHFGGINDTFTSIQSEGVTYETALEVHGRLADAGITTDKTLRKDETQELSQYIQRKETRIA